MGTGPVSRASHNRIPYRGPGPTPDTGIFRDWMFPDHGAIKGPRLARISKEGISLDRSQ